MNNTNATLQPIGPKAKRAGVSWHAPGAAVSASVRKAAPPAVRRVRRADLIDNLPHPTVDKRRPSALVAELVDALVSGTSG